MILRQPTQDAPEEVRARDFRRELEERERVAVREKTRERGPRGEFPLRLFSVVSIISVYINCSMHL